MTDHQKRIHEHLVLETKTLLLEGERARLLDHGGNRGSEAEHGVLRWLRARFAPSYSISSGEIIDSFDTNAERASRQQDGVLHRNDADANRFVLPSGLRLIPVETVAAVVEVKLTLSKDEFEKSDAAATETAKLRYRVGHGAKMPDIAGTHLKAVSQDAVDSGLAVNDPQLGHCRPTFAVFAFGGIKEPETLAGWLRNAKTITLVCCLDAGCVSRFDDKLCDISLPGHELAKFAGCIGGAISRYSLLYEATKPDFRRYGEPASVPYWDASGYEHPAWYTPSAESLEMRELLYQQRPALRPRR